MTKTTSIPFLLAAGLLAGIGFSSCGGNDEEGGGAGKGAGTETPEVTAAAREEAKKTFEALCVTCHGKSGKGDGPGGKSLDPKPRDWTNAEWQESVTDTELRKTIVEGGPAVGLSVGMPPNPTLESKPGVAQALVEIVRSYKGK